jgi:hypothetical protein
MKNGFLGDNDMVFLADIFEEYTTGFFEGIERDNGRHCGFKNVQTSVMLEDQNRAR